MWIIYTHIYTYIHAYIFLTSSYLWKLSLLARFRDELKNTNIMQLSEMTQSVGINQIIFPSLNYFFLIAYIHNQCPYWKQKQRV